MNPFITLKDLNLFSLGHTINMTGVVYTGEGNTLIIPFPDDVKDFSLKKNPLKILEMGTDDWTTFLRQVDILETEALVKAPHGKVEKAIVRKSQRQIAQKISWSVYKRDGYACRYCANDDTPLTVDHLVLWEEGGPSIPENLVASCKKCNKARGDTQYPDWLRHPRYLKTSEKLTAAGRQANEDLVPTLDKIQRSPLKNRSR